MFTRGQLIKCIGAPFQFIISCEFVDISGPRLSSVAASVASKHDETNTNKWAWRNHSHAPTCHPFRMLSQGVHDVAHGVQLLPQSPELLELRVVDEELLSVGVQAG